MTAPFALRSALFDKENLENRLAARAALDAQLTMSLPDPELVALDMVWRRRGGEPLQPDIIDERVWVLALDDLISQEDLSTAAWAAPQLLAAFPHVKYLATIATALAKLPPPTGDGAFDGFVDDTTAALQVVRREGASVAVIAFCGFFHQLGLRTPLMHRWFGAMGVHVLYLRDFSKRLFSEGAPGVGATLAETQSALSAALAAIGAQRLVCYGNSAGGYGALSYGLDLGAEAILSLSGPTTGAPEFTQKAYKGRWQRDAGALAVPDLAPAFKQALHPPHSHLVFGADSPGDRAQAENLEGLPGVTLEALPGVADHGVIKHLIRTGRLDALLAWLAAPTASFYDTVRGDSSPAS